MDGALEEDVDPRAICRSIFWCLSRMSPEECVAVRTLHAANRAHQQEDQYFDTLLDLMSEPTWRARSQALQHYRKTAGIESHKGVQVNVDQRTAIVGQVSFESVLDDVRRRIGVAEDDQPPK